MTDLDAARREAEKALVEIDGYTDRVPSSEVPYVIDRTRGALFALLAATTPAAVETDEIARLTALLHECNAVCLCGCPASEHESLGEDGEGCGHDDHECIRVPRSVLAHVVALRKRPSLPPGVREAAERLRRAMVIGESYSCSNEECIDCRAHDLLAALVAPAPEPEGEEKGVGK